MDIRQRCKKARIACMCLIYSGLVVGCATSSRLQAPLPPYSNAQPPGFPADVRYVSNETVHKAEKRVRLLLKGVSASVRGRAINILALSGGGAGAAYGAGVLVGWSRTGLRPQFTIVTGASAGALIAPFAFLGSGWDKELIDFFAGQEDSRLLQSRWFPWLDIFFGASYYQGAPLRALIDRNVTEKLVKAVAAQTAEGRLLLISTTDLDSGQTVVWNMGVIARQGGSKALKLFRQVLIASASIPGVFPPVLIRVESGEQSFDEMHVDGATASPLPVAPGIVALLKGPFQILNHAHLYVIVNGQIQIKQQTTPMATISISKRSVVVALANDTEAAIERAYTFAKAHQMRIRVTEISNSYPYKGPLNVTPSAMKALFEYGIRCAAANRVWSEPLHALEAHVARNSGTLGKSIRCPVALPVRPMPDSSKHTGKRGVKQ